MIHIASPNLYIPIIAYFLELVNPLILGFQGRRINTARRL